MTAVCHGAPGIGLARLRMLRRTADHDLERDVDAALETTLRYGWGRNHSLCHGDLGNLELLLDASLASDDDRLSDELARASAAVVDDIDRRGWRCANPDELESPELMTGLAGIGYALLRLAAPRLVPSVLVLSAAPSTPVPALGTAGR
jgi:lantibiotic modifying enzyme